MDKNSAGQNHAETEHKLARSGISRKEHTRAGSAGALFGYDRFPSKDLQNQPGKLWDNLQNIIQELKTVMSVSSEGILVVDGYHGVDFEELKKILMEHLPHSKIIPAASALKDEEVLHDMLASHVTDDRVFGYMAPFGVEDYLDAKKVERLQKQAAEDSGWTILYGTGADCLIPAENSRRTIRIYADLTRWEIQLRYRSGRLANWGCSNYGEDPLRMFKRGYFVEWRALDRYKHKKFPFMDYFLDTINPTHPVMADQTLMQSALDTLAHSPYRMVPYFDAGIWGGKWMENICDLPPAANNYAWCFDGVPEENSLAVIKDGIRFEFPAMNLTMERPRQLLGEHVFSRFGAEFPIRFDFLDTMGGGNLSLQVHPNTWYIKDQFGMSYTQDESYYILDAKEDASVFLGVKDGIGPGQLIPALQKAQEVGSFDAQKYINQFPAKKHDHFSIPAGTIHCSGKNAMVLEISATPYIFTFKLWDWGRLGFDGRPRPVNISRGAENIDYRRTTEWCRTQLFSRNILAASGAGWKVEKTGLHPLEFLETRRICTSRPLRVDTDGSVQMLNLVDGEAARISSPEGAFDSLVVHYAETWIVPASVLSFVITPLTEHAEQQNQPDIMVMQASIRNPSSSLCKHSYSEFD